jgi:hypothetical protein
VKRVLLAIVVTCSLAHADERSTTVTAGVMTGGFAEPMDDGVDGADGVLGLRLTLAWEHAPLAMPAEPGFRAGGALVPELFVGSLADDVHAEGFVGAGVRAELRISQLEMGLLKLSARGAVYVAARGLVLGEHQAPFGEIAVGDYWAFGRTSHLRVGIEGSVLVGAHYQMTDAGRDRRVGGVVQLLLGWGL